MAGSKCEKCKAQYADLKAVCPNCNSAIKAPSSLSKLRVPTQWLVVLFALLLIVSALTELSTRRPVNMLEQFTGDRIMRDAPSGTATGENAKASHDSHAKDKSDSTARDAVVSESEWSYKVLPSSINPSQKVAVAILPSKHTSPYIEEQRPMLLIRNHPSSGHEVIVLLNDGEINFDELNMVDISIAIDGRSAQVMQGGAPDNLERHFVFLPQQEELVAKIAASKQVRIRLPIANRPAIFLDFNTAGLDLTRF